MGARPETGLWALYPTRVQVTGGGLTEALQCDCLSPVSPAAVAHTDRHRPLPPAASKEQKRGQ